MEYSLASRLVQLATDNGMAMRLYEEYTGTNCDLPPTTCVVCSYDTFWIVISLFCLNSIGIPPYILDSIKYEEISGAEGTRAYY